MKSLIAAFLTSVVAALTGAPAGAVVYQARIEGHFVDGLQYAWKENSDGLLDSLAGPLSGQKIVVAFTAETSENVRIPSSCLEDWCFFPLYQNVSFGVEAHGPYEQRSDIYWQNAPFYGGGSWTSDQLWNPSIDFSGQSNSASFNYYSHPWEDTQLYLTFALARASDGSLGGTGFFDAGRYPEYEMQLVGNFIIDRGWYVAGVPEPASWALLILGFAMIGHSQRRGRRNDRTQSVFNASSRSSA